MIHGLFHGYGFVEVVCDENSILINPFINGNEICELDMEQLKNKNIKSIIISSEDINVLNDAIEIAKSVNCNIIGSDAIKKYAFDTHGFDNIDTFDKNQIFESGELKINFINQFSSLSKDISSNNLLYSCILSLKDKNIYYSSFSGLPEDISILFNFSKIDIAFLPIGTNLNMGIKDAVSTVGFIKPGIVVPIHYNNSPDTIVQSIDFAREVMLENYSVPKPLKPGQYVVLD